MSKVELKVVVYKDGKHFVGQCLDIDVSSFGKTEKDALSNLTEALELYLEDGPLPKSNSVIDPKVRTLHLEYA